MKKISLLIALVLCMTMAFSACKKDTDKKPVSGETSVSDKASDGDKTDESSAETLGDGETAVTPLATEKPAPDTTYSTEMDSASKVRYTYTTLTDDEKDLYAKILAGAKNHQTTVSLGKKVPFKTIQKIFGLIYFQEPQLFWLSGSYEVFDGDADTTALYYVVGADEVKAKQAEIDAKVAKIKETVPKGATTVDKLKTIHDFIAKNCDFTKDGTYVQTIYGGLIDGKIQCEGYAKTVAYLCDQFGIENMLMTGTNDKKASHAWNIIKVDGDWYNFDTTWDDPVGMNDPDYVRYNYFNVTDEEILNKTHFQDLTYFTPPKCTATKANYFNNYKLVASSYAEAEKMIKEQIIEASKTKTKQVQIRVSSKAVYDECKTKLKDKGGIFKVLEDANGKAKNKLDISAPTCAFDENIFAIEFNLKYK
ncbi:MAG: transglutaminase domain-containing protein [Oscillospiraceae bacterium]